MILKIIYTVFIGVLFAILVGVGIEAFYPSPKEPEYPSALKIPREGGLSEPVFLEMKKEQENYDHKFKIFQDELKVYNRNVSIVTVIFAILTLAVSLTFFKKILIIADGVLLGGVLTLLYSIGRGFNSGDDKFRFGVVLVGFVVALVLGYIKFIKPAKIK